MVIFSVGAAGSFLVAFLLWLETQRTRRAVPRLRVTTGVVRELESVLTDRRAGTVNSSTLVQVDFNVGGKSYCCRTLYLFAGNRHVGDVGKKFDFPPGQVVGVHYDPENPRLSALIVDRPRQDTVVIAVLVGVILAIFAAVKAS